MNGVATKKFVFYSATKVETITFSQYDLQCEREWEKQWAIVVVIIIIKYFSIAFYFVFAHEL